MQLCLLDKKHSPIAIRILRFNFIVLQVLDLKLQVLDLYPTTNYNQAGTRFFKIVRLARDHGGQQGSQPCAGAFWSCKYKECMLSRP